MNRHRQQLIPLRRARTTRQCGGKACNLGRLIRAGYPVPPGFVIPDTAYQEHLRSNGILADCQALLDALPSLAPDAIARRACAIRHRIVAAPLSGTLRRALARHWRWRDGAAAVRSSAISEDSATSSFAGLLDSVLHVREPGALENAIRTVWASLWSERSLLYAQRKQAVNGHMGVIVQDMVTATHSGVVFSRDPTAESGDEAVIEYVQGYGDALVAGAVVPSRAWVSRSTHEIRSIPARTMPMEQPLSEPVLRELASLAVDLERRFAAAQDIEWSLDQAGRITLLQTRPITMARSREKEVWSNANIAENFPEPISPLLASIVCRGYTAYFRGLGHAFGISSRRMNAMSKPLERIVGVHAGRLYYNLTSIHSAIHAAPFGKWLAHAFNDFTGASGDHAHAPAPAPALVRAAEQARIALRTTWHYLTIQRRITRFEAVVDRYAAATERKALAALDARELHQRLREFMDIRLHRWTDASLADVGAMVSFGLLKRSVQEWLSTEDAALCNNFLTGLPGLASLRPVHELWRLSRLVRADAELLELFSTHSPAEILGQLHAPAYGEFRALFDTYLRDWGFRYSRELMLSVPTPVEAPEPVIALLRAYVHEADDRLEQATASAKRLRQQATVRAVAQLRPAAWPAMLPAPKAVLFRILLRATHATIGLRERARMKQALLYTQLRHVILATGELLVRRNLLRTRDDIFYLTLDEIRGLLNDASPVPATVQAQVDIRQRACAAHQRMAPPDSFVLPWGEQWSAPMAPTQPIAPGGIVLHGSRVSSGHAEGPASVVLDVTEAASVSDGQILVTRQTDPAWAAVFLLIKGLVVERGGILSHGAIIAREYGIPALVGVEHATSRIKSGDWLRLDGDSGLVSIRR